MLSSEGVSGGLSATKAASLSSADFDGSRAFNFAVSDHQPAVPAVSAPQAPSAPSNDDPAGGGKQRLNGKKGFKIGMSLREASTTVSRALSAMSSPAVGSRIGRSNSKDGAGVVVDERIERFENIRDAVEALHDASASTSAALDAWTSGIIELAEAYESIAGQMGDSESATLISDVQKFVEFSYQTKSLGEHLKQRFGDVQANATRQMESNERALRSLEAATESENERQKSVASLRRLNEKAILHSQVKSAEKALTSATERSRKTNMEADQADLEACNSARTLLFENSFNELTEGLQYFLTKATVGLAGVQPIETKPMSSYSSEQEGQSVLEDLKVLATTFNAGEMLPDNDDMQHWMPYNLLEQHHIVVFALQEAAVEGGHDDGQDDDTVAEEAATSSSIATSPIVAAGRRDRTDDPMERKIQQYLEGTSTKFKQLPQTITSSVYKWQRIMRRPSIRLNIFVRADIFDRVHSVQVEAINTGYPGAFNKGAVVCCLNVDATPLVFVSSHLSAHEGASKCLRRNADVMNIMREAKKNIRCPKLDIEAIGHHIFWLGDLNYRVTALDGTPADADCREEIHRSIVRRDYAAVLRGDELTREQKAGRVFSEYETPDPSFAPTFKVMPGSMDAEYTPKRTPSYTDRILVHSLPGAKIATESYEAVFNVKSSDHKPVRGTYTISGRKAQARLRGHTPSERRPKVLFRSITVHLNDARGFAAREVLVEVHTDPWWAHGYHGYSRCATESKPVVCEGAPDVDVHFDFRQGPVGLRSAMNPEAEFRIGTLEGAHLFLCLIDPSKRAMSESGLGHSVLSMDAVWEQQVASGDRLWNLNLISDGLIIGKMSVDLEVLNWGDTSYKAESNLEEPNLPETDGRAMIHKFEETMMRGPPRSEEMAVMATVVPEKEDSAVTATVVPGAADQSSEGNNEISTPTSNPLAGLTVAAFGGPEQWTTELAQLSAMGFNDVHRNVELLQRYNGRLVRVANVLAGPSPRAGRARSPFASPRAAGGRPSSPSPPGSPRERYPSPPRSPAALSRAGGPLVSPGGSPRGAWRPSPISIPPTAPATQSPRAL